MSYWIAGGTIVAGVAGGAMQAGAASDAADKQGAATQAAIDAQNQNLARTRSDLAPYQTAGTAAITRLQALLGLNGTPGGTQNAIDSDAWKSYVAGGGYAPGATGAPANADTVDNAYDQAARRRIYDSVGTGIDSNDSSYGSLLKKFSQSDLDADPIYKNALDFSTQQGEKAINARAASTGSYDSGAALKALAKFDQGNVTQYGNDAFTRYETGNNDAYTRLMGLSGIGENAAALTGTAGSNAANTTSGLISAQGNANAAASIAGSNALSGSLSNGLNAYNNQNLLAQLSGGGARAGDYNDEMARIRGQI